MKSLLLKLTLLLLSAHTIMAAAIVAPGLPEISHYFSATRNAELLSKLILSFPALFIAVSAPLAGRFIDRHGRLRLLYIGLILYVVSGTSGYYLDNLFSILVGRIFLGISIGIVMTVTVTLIGDYFEGLARQRFLGVQTAFIGFAGVAFLALGGLLADLNWRYPFLIYLLPILIVPLVMIALKEPEILVTTVPSKRLQLNSLIKWIYLTAISFMILFYIIPTQLPFQLQQIGVAGNSISGAVLGINALGVVLSSLFYGHIRERWDYSQIYTVSFLIMALSYFAAVQTSSLMIMYIAMLFAGAGFGLIIPNTNLWLIELSPGIHRGRNLGLLHSFMFLGQFLSPLLMEPVVRWQGLPAVFMLASILLAAIAFAFLSFRSKLSKMDRVFSQMLKR